MQLLLQSVRHTPALVQQQLCECNFPAGMSEQQGKEPGTLAAQKRCKERKALKPLAPALVPPHLFLMEVAVGGGHEQLDDDVAVAVIFRVDSNFLRLHGAPCDASNGRSCRGQHQPTGATPKWG